VLHPSSDLAGGAHAAITSAAGIKESLIPAVDKFSVVPPPLHSADDGDPPGFFGAQYPQRFSAKRIGVQKRWHCTQLTSGYPSVISGFSFRQKNFTNDWVKKFSYMDFATFLRG